MAISMKNNAMTKIFVVLFALALAFVSVGTITDVFVEPSIAHASGAFDQVDVNNDGAKDITAAKTKSVENGVFKDMNNILKVFLGLAGIIVIMCIVFAGIKLATAQNNPQNRTQGFIGLGMALLGGWVIYKALDLAGWIQGFGT